MARYFSQKPHKVETFARDGKKIPIYHYMETTQHYAQSFGEQWNRYQQTQIDSLNGTKGTLRHLEMMLGAPVSSLKGKTVLEIGSGAGRYTEYFAKYAKEVVTVDPSTAIYANVAIGESNVTAVRGDLFDLPVNRVFDIVFCRGVIQHTFSPQIAIWQLYSYAKEDGDIIFDVYAKSWRKFFYTYYYLRPFTKRMPRQKFHAFLQKVIPPLLWFKMYVLNPITPNVRYIKEIPDIILPIFDYSRLMPELDWKQNVEWAILNCHDAYTPEYDTPLSWREVMSVVDNLPHHKVVFADKDMFRFRIRKKIR